MGVPALFRWLSSKYPKIISQVKEDEPYEMGDGTLVPVDCSQPNPNGEEFDNLYLDMNGIVHPCSHPEDKDPPETEGEMMLEVFKYTERVVNMCRPRKVLMMAVDGVAPRAKMNQQRARRFKGARDAEEKAEEQEKILKEKRAKGEISAEGLAALEKQPKAWDSNAITPGTPFMHLLAESLRYWTAYKLNTDPAWKNLKIIISDASVPGEGEHKIMEFVRSQRSSPDHDPNTRHVIYGLDADLIMLGLATHEPHFRVLREDVFFDQNKPNTCRICGQTGHFAADCTGAAKEKEGEFDEKKKAVKKPFIWLHVGILREYLAIEMHVPNQGFAFDLERALDDWVFMCFFVGNDFLPHLPSLDIKNEGIDILIAIWRDNIGKMGGYVTKDGKVDLKKAQVILQGLAKQETAIFKKRREMAIANQRKGDARKARRERENGGNKRQRRSEPNFKLEGPPANSMGVDTVSLNSLKDQTRAHKLDTSPNGQGDAIEENKNAAKALREKLLKGKTNKEENNNAEAMADAFLEELDTTPAVQQSTVEESNGDVTAESAVSAVRKRKADELEEGDGPSTPGRKTPEVAPPQAEEGPPERDEDNVEIAPGDARLWEDGYVERYYSMKFGVAPEDVEFRHKVARSYTEGLAWVLEYYFQGCPSWTWYYPYHYAPFAADFVDVDKNVHIDFHKGQPFRPYEQLMGVLPAASRKSIPAAFHPLMTESDSPIIDFYPVDFEYDMNGQSVPWKGVVILPFIDEKRLLDAMGTKYPLLTENEHVRNAMGFDVLYMSDAHPVATEILNSVYGKSQVEKLTLNPRKSDRLIGTVSKDNDYIPFTTRRFPGEDNSYPDIEDDHAVSVAFFIPKSPNVHKSMLLRGAKVPPPVLDREDIDQAIERAKHTGRSFGGAPLGGGRGGFNGGRGNRGYGGGRGGPRGGGGRHSGDFDYGVSSQRNGYNGGYNGGYNNGPPGGNYGNYGSYPPQPPPHWQPPPPGAHFAGGFPPPPPPGGNFSFPSGFPPPPGIGGPPPPPGMQPPWMQRGGRGGGGGYANGGGRGGGGYGRGGY